MNNKKAVINQVFVYIMSTIAIIFVGVLVTKFIIALQTDTKAIIEDKFYSGLDNDLKQVAARYGSEEILEYKLGSEIKNVCFVSTPSCADQDFITNNKLNIEENELQILSENANLLIFNEDGISTEKNLIKYSSSVGNGCFCIKPDNNRFELLLENRKNKLFISEYK